MISVLTQEDICNCTVTVRVGQNSTSFYSEKKQTNAQTLKSGCQTELPQSMQKTTEMYMNGQFFRQFSTDAAMHAS